MVNLIVWLLLGALAGWIASVITRNDGRMGAILNIAVGVVGAALGGFFMRAIGEPGANVNNSFSLYAVLVSILGAVVLLAIVNLFTRGRLTGSG